MTTSFFPGRIPTESSFPSKDPSPEATARVERALGIRRAAALAGQMPGYWLLDSPGLTGVVATAKRLARAPGVPVLIEGERGTGVVELARVIHDADPTARRARMRVMPAHLVGPSEMRGWALDGTLFIEDVENLRPAGQAWVAEMLAARPDSLQPMRVVAGSRYSAGRLLRQIGLSQELIHALDVGRLLIPPLRERRDDIPELARRFLEHCAERHGRPALRFSEAAEGKLLAYSYPANVRELRNVVERAAALTLSEEVDADAVILYEHENLAQARAELVRSPPAVGRQSVAHLPTLAELERDYIVMLIRELRGHRGAIARAMGVSYPTVARKIANHGLDVKAIVKAARAPLLSVE